jgi:hypothetical protein
LPFNKLWVVAIWGFLKMGDSLHGWFLTENPIKTDVLEVPPF